MSAETPEAWDDSEASLNSKLTNLNVNAAVFVPNVNAAVFVPKAPNITGQGNQFSFKLFNSYSASF